MGSLFDGIGGFPLAASRYGIKTLWASEIETFPIAVTKLRFPDMIHVGDITKLKGADLPPVDIIAGGSPCQNLSVASTKRLGLAGERSGLFMEQIRVSKVYTNNITDTVIDTFRSVTVSAFLCAFCRNMGKFRTLQRICGSGFHDVVILAGMRIL